MLANVDCSDDELRAVKYRPGVAQFESRVSVVVLEPLPKEMTHKVVLGMFFTAVQRPSSRALIWSIMAELALLQLEALPTLLVVRRSKKAMP